ncbi:MAG: hydroxymethylglutaryl-CoA lyase [Desulforhopalus sp.]|jgi:hydroxymethylglutaryl-CoA lyase
MNNSETIVLEDETLRDGLQVERYIFSIEEKLSIYKSLVGSGLKRIQVGSFVHHQLVPQLAETDELIRAIQDECNDGCVVSALVLNERGLQRALDSKIEHLTMSVSVSETHSKKNTGKSAVTAKKQMVDLIGNAHRAGIIVRAGIQCAFGCSYDGVVDKNIVLETATLMSEAGAVEINLADTAGIANPRIITDIVTLIQDALPKMTISLHAHDTHGFGLVNMYSGYMAGVRNFDVCVGGLGGCPAVESAAGNVATEDAVRLFEALGENTGVNNNEIYRIIPVLEQKLRKKLL